MLPVEKSPFPAFCSFLELSIFFPHFCRHVLSYLCPPVPAVWLLADIIFAGLCSSQQKVHLLLPASQGSVLSSQVLLAQQCEIPTCPGLFDPIWSGVDFSHFHQLLLGGFVDQMEPSEPAALEM